MNGGDSMESIGERITLILKNAGKKQKDLAELLAITSSSVSTMCSGKSKPSSQNISLICKEFGVRREWLETGEGDMYIPMSENERIAEYLGGLLRGSVDTDIRLRLISVLPKLGPDEWNALYRVAVLWTQGREGDEIKEGQEENKEEEGQA